jgi:hypothetical protein
MSYFVTEKSGSYLRTFPEDETIDRFSITDQIKVNEIDGHVARVEDMRHVFVGKLEGNRPFRRCRHI